MKIINIFASMIFLIGKILDHCLLFTTNMQGFIGTVIFIIVCEYLLGGSIIKDWRIIKTSYKGRKLYSTMLMVCQRQYRWWTKVILEAINRSVGMKNLLALARKLLFLPRSSL